MLDTTKLKLEHVVVSNIDSAIRGMRNPLESHHLSDSKHTWNPLLSEYEYTIGKNDLQLAIQLRKAGSDHRKFLRQIFVSFDLTMPEYFWKQYHTYKVSTTENSSSQMHTLGRRFLTTDDFIMDDMGDLNLEFFNCVIKKWQETKDKDIWRRRIQIMQH